MWILISILLLLPVSFFTIGIILSAPKYKGPVSDHFDGKRFINPTGVRAKGFTDVLKWMTNRERTPWKNVSENSVKPDRPLKFFDQGIKITFINHTTFLIQVDKLNILTDPVWSKRVSPFTFAGPKRVKAPGLRLEDLPRIDVVLLSHNHYDHLDVNTLRVINGAHHPTFVTPLGVGAYLHSKSIGKPKDLDWWMRIALSSNISVTAVPAQHFSGRGMLDRDATLWCGYVIETPAGTIYFAGDTGYNDTTFKSIGDKFQNINVSIIPIGAYKPRWFMSPIHVAPEEAVKIHQDVRTQKSIASHFGTFPLADEGYLEPVRDLQAALKESDISLDDFIVLGEGGSVILS